METKEQKSILDKSAVERIALFVIRQWSSIAEQREPDHESLVSRFMLNDLPEFLSQENIDTIEVSSRLKEAEELANTVDRFNVIRHEVIGRTPIVTVEFEVSGTIQNFHSLLSSFLSKQPK